MPKVSVVSGFYNRAHLLERTCNSIAGQTYRDFEFIVFDDASTDDTAHRLREVGSKFAEERFTAVIHKENIGFVAGLIDAIERSSGEYIAIQGSGDVSLPRRLSRQVDYLDAHPEVGVVGSWYYNVSEGIGAKRLRTPDADTASYESLLRENLFSHGEVMIRRSVYDLVGGYRPEFRYSQDYDLWLRISRVAKFGTVKEPLYERYVQFDGVSYDSGKVIVQACYSVAARQVSAMGDTEQTAALERIVSQGPTSLVDLSHRDVQAKVRKAAARSLMFGSAENAREIVRAGVVRWPERAFWIVMISLLSTRVSRPLRSVIGRLLGIARI